MKQKAIIVITAGFPFGSGESFLETEIRYLAERYDKVHLVSQDTLSDIQRPVPANCVVHRLHHGWTGQSKYRALFGLLSYRFWQELITVVFTYKKFPTKLIFSTLLVSLQKVKIIGKLLVQIYERECLSYSTTFYSYWCDDVAISLALIKKVYPDITCVSRVHGWDLYFEVNEAGYLPYRQLIHQQLDALFSISQKGIDYIKNTWLIKDTGKTRIARLGVEKRKILTPFEDEILLVSCSNLIPLKRVDLLIDSLALLNQSNVKWVHFGDGPMRKELEERVETLLKGKIQVEWKGQMKNHELMEWYENNRPQLFINLSTSEGVPVSIMEAFSFGIPVLATDVGGTGEIVNEQNGFLIPVSTAADVIAALIQQFIELPEEEKQAKRLVAYGTWDKYCNAEKNYEEFIDSMQNLVCSV